MAFHFRLKTLLRIRSVREELERERLLGLQTKLHSAEQSIRELNDRAHASRNFYLEKNDASVAGSQLQFLHDCARTSTTAEANAKTMLQKIRKSCEEQQQRYQAAHRDCAMLEKLRERQLHEFRLQEARVEQRWLDEAFTLTNGNRGGQPLPTK